MEHNLVWGSLAVGCIGWLCALALAKSARSAESGGLAKLHLYLASALPIVVWLATLPASPPFSDGQGWGRGFGMGGELYRAGQTPEETFEKAKICFQAADDLPR